MKKKKNAPSLLWEPAIPLRDLWHKLFTQLPYPATFVSIYFSGFFDLREQAQSMTTYFFSYP